MSFYMYLLHVLLTPCPYEHFFLASKHFYGLSYPNIIQLLTVQTNRQLLYLVSSHLPNSPYSCLYLSLVLNNETQA